MNWNRPLASCMLFCALLVLPSLNAGVRTYTSESVFNALGTSSQSSDFDSFTSGVDFVGAGYTAGDLQFTNPATLLVAPDFLGLSIRTVITANDYTALTVNITGVHDLLAFDVGRLARTDYLTAYAYKQLSPTLLGTIHTNLGSYDVELDKTPLASKALRFYGFALDGEGEYFTGFSFRASEYTGTAVGMTDLRLGEASVHIPDSGAGLGLFCLCLGALASLSRRLSKRG